MRYEPFPHAAEAHEFQMDNPRSALWLKMGLHKTVITATTMERHFDELNATRWLVVGTKRIINSTWPEELAKWDHLWYLRHQVLDGSIPAKRRQHMLHDPDIDIDLVSYDNLIWLIGYANRHYRKTGEWLWQGVTFDEASKLKEPNTRRFPMVRDCIDRFDYVYHLAGSPSPNGLLDVWGQMRLLDGESMGLGPTKEHYRMRFFQSIPGKWRPEILDGADEIIHELVKPAVFSVAPPDQGLRSRNLYHRVQLPTEHRRQYRQLENEMFLQLEDHTVEAMNAGVLIGKCQQFANGAIWQPLVEGMKPSEREWTVVHDAKLDMLDDIIEEAAGAPVLVAYQFKHDLARILKRFPQARELDTNPATIDAWNRGEIPVLCLHPASAGHGLNLQWGGSQIVWFGVPWNFEHYEQTNARLLRTGQLDEVLIHHVICEDTVEEEVLIALRHKASVQQTLLDAVARDPGRRAA